jgi:hypothetical protein
MRCLTRAGVGLAFALVLSFGVAGCSQANEGYAPKDVEPAAEGGFPWVCFATSVAGLASLYVLVRRREQLAELDQKHGRGNEIGWYCRTCQRDVSGPECPRCRAANPFVEEATDGWERKQESARSRRAENRRFNGGTD